MAGGKADIVEVVVLTSGADALLDAGCPLVPHPALAGEYVLELVHASISEQQRRIVKRNDRRGGDDTVVVFLEIAQERLSNLSCFNLSLPHLAVSEVA